MIALLDDAISLGKGRRHVAALMGHPQPQIGANLLVNGDGIVSHGGHRVEDRRHGLIVDQDAFQGISRLVAVPGHNDSHGLADIAHLTPRQYRLLDQFHLID